MYLVIKNSGNIKSFKITINEKEIDANKLFRNEKSYNLSHYLIDGLNKIKVEITDETLPSEAQAKVYIVVKEADDE